MGRVSQAIGRVFTGGAKAFTRYPAAMFSALITALAATVLVAMDNPQDDKLFTTLLIAFSGAAIWGMAVAVLGERARFGRMSFTLVNIAALFAACGLFAYLYLSFTLPEIDMPFIVLARILAGALAAFIIFLLVISADYARSDYNQAAFMTLKSFLIALIYALVIMLGLFFVTFSVESLIYDGLSEKTYAYIAIWSAFIGFAFFLGYFPRFRRNEQDSRLDIAQKHPAFIEILFAYVMVPIVFIMTIVLFVWAVQTLIVGDWQEFGLLTGIFTAYTLTGIFLWIMVSHYTQSPAVFYRRVFPFCSLLFLAFEAYVIYRQITELGIKTTEYFIILLWLFALLATVVLLLNRPPRNRLIGYLALVLTIVSVLPYTSFQAVPVASQTAWLRTVLNKNDMFVAGSIVSAPKSISLADKITITDAARFLMQDDYASIRKAPWLAEKLDAKLSFAKIFGFAETYADHQPAEHITKEIHLYLQDAAVMISDYDYAVAPIGDYTRPITVAGIKNNYEISLLNMDGDQTPSIRVMRDNQLLANESLDSWVDFLTEKYADAGKLEPPIEDMTVKIQHDEFHLMVVFRSVSIMAGVGDEKTVYLYPEALYLGE